MAIIRYTEADLANSYIRQTIPPKWEVYYVILEIGRCFGYRRTPKQGGKWVARIKIKTGYQYCERIIGKANDSRTADGIGILTYEQAKQKALAWFDSPELMAIRKETRPLDWQIEPNICPIGSEYTVAHAMRDYCNWKRSFHARQSYQAAVSRANVYILPLLGSLLCSELTPMDCRSLLLTVEGSYLNRRNGKQLERVDPNRLAPEVRRKRRVSANNVFCDFRSALNLAFGDGHIASNAAWREVRLFTKTHRGRTDILTWAQAKHLIDIAPPEFQRLILAALYTGCRITEIFKMKVVDLDLTRAAMYVSPVKSYKGRIIALPDEGYEFFKSLAGQRSGDSPLVPRNGGGPWTTHYVSVHIKRLLKKVGAPQGFVFHSLRHTYASLLLRAGTPPIVVARQLGHANMETTLRVYAHVTDDFMDHEFRNRYKPGFLTSPDLLSEITNIDRSNDNLPKQLTAN